MYNKKFFEDVCLGTNSIHWISPANIWNSTTIWILIYTHITCLVQNRWMETERDHFFYCQNGQTSQGFFGWLKIYQCNFTTRIPESFPSKKKSNLSVNIRGIVYCLFTGHNHHKLLLGFWVSSRIIQLWVEHRGKCNFSM